MNAGRFAPWGKGLLTAAVLLLVGLFVAGSGVHALTGNPAPAPAAQPTVTELWGNIQAIAAGYGHTCAVSESGGVKCWGNNDNGQLGDGTTDRRLTPVDVAGLTGGVQMVAAGWSHTCALTVSGGVKCWGNNTYGQLGDGTADNRLTPVDVPGLTGGVQMVAAGWSHTCALTVSGGVKCWGNNTYGQLGDSTTTARLLPVDVSSLTSGVQAVTAGIFHTCAVTTSGSIKCWGDNSSGQLGDGTTDSRLTPVDVLDLTSRVQKAAAGASYTCALTTGGVKCWGNNFTGQLGDGTTTSHLTPVDVRGLTGDVQTVAVGAYHTCVLTTSGGVKCWGDNTSGRLGDGTTTSRLAPVDVSSLTSGVQAVAVGREHTCALTTGGGVKCWGRNGFGQLGDGTTANRLTPVDVPGLTNGAQVVAAGWDHTCALMTAGGVKCWGDNYYGQLGDGTAVSRWTPMDVFSLTNSIQMVVVGNLHSCALTTAGDVKCWGNNDDGRLGDGTTDNRLRPVNVLGFTSNVQAIAAGNDHTCALTTAKGVKCWGRNGDGQLGDGTTDSHLTPVDVLGLTGDMQTVAAGASHTCAVTAVGGVKCWGYNGSGQLGDGTTTSRLTPVDVLDLTSGVQVVAIGREHTCAVTAAGGVKCWGRNHDGQLGDGTTDSRLTPVDVSDLTGRVQAVATGISHTCALTTSGVKCWGDNSYGQLGDGTTTDRLTPVNVLGLNDGVQTIAAGAFHTCVLTTSGGVKCWGDNKFGQLGLNPGWTPMSVVGLQGKEAAQITSTPVTITVAGQAYIYTVTATGVPTPTFSLITAPEGMTIDPTSGVIQWTPSAPGEYIVTVHAENGVIPGAEQSFTITVLDKPAEESGLFLPLINK